MASPNDLFNIEMEKFVLGAMLLKDGEIIPTITSILDTDDFYRPEHRIIFNAILRLCDKKIIPNMLSLIEELRTNGTLEKIGFEYLFALMEIAHTTAYAEFYARQIKDKAQLRKLNDIADIIKQKTTEGLANPLDIIAEVNNHFLSFSNNDNEKFSPVGQFIASDFFKFVENRQAFIDRKTGFDNIDAVQILEPGLYVLGATPACGKTTFAWQLLEQMAYKGEYCIFCSYEMSKYDLVAKTFARKLFAEYGGSLSAAEIKRGAFNPNLPNILDHMLDFDNFTVRKFSNENVDKLLAILRPIVINADKPPVVCIDYLQRLIPRDIKAYDTRALIDDALFKLKDFSVETNTTFFVVSTFNRTNYNQLVDFEAFKESGGIEYTADVVWALQLDVANKLSGEKIDTIRKKINDAKKQQPRHINLKCLKNRHGNNYDCYFKYFSAHDYFQPCDESDFVIGDDETPKNDSSLAQDDDTTE